MSVRWANVAAETIRRDTRVHYIDGRGGAGVRATLAEYVRQGRCGLQGKPIGSYHRRGIWEWCWRRPIKQLSSCGGNVAKSVTAGLGKCRLPYRRKLESICKN